MGSRRTRRRARARRRRGLRKGIPLGLVEVPPYVEITMKLRCNKCERDLEAEEHFTPRKDVARGYQYTCIECRSKTENKRRQSKKPSGPQDPPKRKRGRPKGATDKRVRKPRNYKEVRRGKMMQDAGAKIAAGELIAESPRTLGFVLRLIVEQQLHLFYGSQINGAPLKPRMNSIISDADFEIKEALSRVGVRMRPVLRSAQMSPAETNTLVRMQRRAEALALLQLEEGATAEEIKKAHKQLARTAHPDAGGSTEQMQELNAALSVLLEETHA